MRVGRQLVGEVLVGLVPVDRAQSHGFADVVHRLEVGRNALALGHHCRLRSARGRQSHQHALPVVGGHRAIAAVGDVGQLLAGTQVPGVATLHHRALEAGQSIATRAVGWIGVDRAARHRRYLSARQLVHASHRDLTDIKLGLAVIVDVATVEGHRGCRRIRQRAFAAVDGAQAAVVVQEHAVGLVKIVADQQIGPAIGIEVDEKQAERVALRPGQHLALEAAASAVAPEMVDSSLRIEEPGSEACGASDDVEPAVTVDVGKGNAADDRLGAARQMNRIFFTEAATAIEEDKRTLFPGRKKQVQCAVAVQIHQRHHPDRPVAHARKIDRLQLEAAAGVQIEEHALMGADHQVGPAIAIHVAAGQGAEMHRPGLHRQVRPRQREATQSKPCAVEPGEGPGRARNGRLEG